MVLGLALGLLLAYRAWLIRVELQDLEALAAQGDRMIQIADEGWAGGFGSVNAVCRNGKFNHLLVSWRMPCHSEPGACDYPKTVDQSWPASGTTEEPVTKQADKKNAASLLFESSDDDVTLASISLSNFAIARREHGEILVSKRLGDNTLKAIGDRIGKSTARFTLNIDEQREWFYLNEFADTPERFASVCKSG